MATSGKGKPDTKVPLRDRIACALIRKAVADELNKAVPKIPNLGVAPVGGFKPHDLPDAPAFDEKPVSECLPIAIIGAGVAGLYSALILDLFNIEYEILESSSRAGGRIFTKSLDSVPEHEGPHDYFDVGAMRFPKIPILRQTFALFDILGVEQIPYFLSGEKNPLLYNNKYWADATTPPPAQEDFFNVSVKNEGTVPDKLRVHFKTPQFHLTTCSETN